MDQEIKQKWISALRSGYYSQTTHTLHRIYGSEFKPVGFCCLGVLCEVMNLSSRSVGKFSIYNYKDTYFFSALPHEKLCNDIGLLIYEVDVISRLNDKDRYNFNQIADYIEDNL